MPYPHSIRLRGPWQFEPLARSQAAPDGQIVEHCDDLPPAGRSTVPCDWGTVLGTDFRGRVGYRRSFNAPATLDPHERLWLVVEGADARGGVWVNGAGLGDVPGYAVWSAFDVTSLVGPRNEIRLEVDLPAGAAALRPGRENLAGGPIGEVRLEVRSAQFLEGLAVFSCGEREEPHLAIRGRIAGEPTQASLAVVIGAGDRELAYLEPRLGSEFEAEFSAADVPVWTPDRPVTAPVEIKLLEGGSSVWRHIVETGFRAPLSTADTARLDAILSEQDYVEFDRKGTTVVQHVPPDWIERVCPRLAHHPSILAWSAGKRGEPSAQTLTFGRPWV
jgi:beta-galactosidase/beta-glucuronidase